MVTFFRHLSLILGSMENWNIHTRMFHGCLSLFPIPIKPQIRRKWLEKCYPEHKLNKNTNRICLIYVSIAQFNDNIKFPLWNLNISNFMLINFHNSLITKRVFRSLTATVAKQSLWAKYYQISINSVIKY